MKTSRLFLCAGLASALLSTSVFATDTQSDLTLPYPVKVVAPTQIPRRYIDSTVQVGFILDEEGCPHDIQVIQPQDQALAGRLIPALAEWRFAPATRHGLPVSRHVILPLTLAE
ncbi:MAG: energy transducer TonB [Opitutales bacterium]